MRPKRPACKGSRWSRPLAGYHVAGHHGVLVIRSSPTIITPTAAGESHQSLPPILRSETLPFSFGKEFRLRRRCARRAENLTFPDSRTEPQHRLPPVPKGHQHERPSARKVRVPYRGDMKLHVSSEKPISRQSSDADYPVGIKERRVDCALSPAAFYRRRVYDGGCII